MRIYDDLQPASIINTVVMEVDVPSMSGRMLSRHD
jgi:hypothetical protein